MMVCMVILMAGCTTMKITKPDGTAMEVSRLPFATANFTYIDQSGSSVGFDAAQDPGFNQNLMNLNNLALTAASIYGKSMTGGLAPTVQSEPQAVLVPKAAAATPPPAEIPLVK